MPNPNRTINRKPSSNDLARATSTIWDRWYQDVLLDDGELYRSVGGVDMDPGEYTLRELLNLLYATVEVWSEGNYGRYGARQFVANMVERGLLRVHRSAVRGLPSKYTVADDPATGLPYTRESFLETAHAYRKLAYLQAQADKGRWDAKASGGAQPDLPKFDYSDLVEDLKAEGVI